MFLCGTKGEVLEVFSGMVVGSMLVPAVWFGQDLEESWQMKAEETCRCVIL